MGTLNGKTAIVTGASRGIGRAIALRLAKEGARLVLCAMNRELLDGTAREIQSAGGEAAWIALDLRKPEAPSQLAGFAQEKFSQIDIVVNNAGATKRGEFQSLTDGDWADGFALKFFGAVRLTRAAWPQLKKTRGSVLNISGTGGRTPGPHFTIGGSVNAAMLSFTKAMADVGVRDGIQVNAICPGLVRTERFQVILGNFAKDRGLDPQSAEPDLVRHWKITRVGEPDDIAGLVTFIVSPAGRFLQGALIDMDGGATKSV